MSMIDLGLLGEWDERLMSDHIDALDMPGNISLEEAGIEDDASQPCHEFNTIHDVVAWFSDGEDSRYTE
jgi:hypothetical protein